MCVYQELILYIYIYMHTHTYIVHTNTSPVGSPIFSSGLRSGAAMPRSALSQPAATATAREPHGGPGSWESWESWESWGILGNPGNPGESRYGGFMWFPSMEVQIIHSEWLLDWDFLESSILGPNWWTPPHILWGDQGNIREITHDMKRSPGITVISMGN